MSMALKNVMETIVRDVLLHNKSNLHLLCECEHCLEDIMANALNQLPPRYIVNEEHQPYVRVMHEADKEGALTILKVVAQSAAVVSKNPRCASQQSKNIT